LSFDRVFGLGCGLLLLFCLSYLSWVAGFSRGALSNTVRCPPNYIFKECEVLPDLDLNGLCEPCVCDSCANDCFVHAVTVTEYVYVDAEACSDYCFSIIPKCELVVDNNSVRCVAK